MRSWPPSTWNPMPSVPAGTTLSDRGSSPLRLPPLPAHDWNLILNGYLAAVQLDAIRLARYLALRSHGPHEVVAVGLVDSVAAALHGGDHAAGRRGAGERGAAPHLVGD